MGKVRSWTSTCARSVSRPAARAIWVEHTDKQIPKAFGRRQTEGTRAPGIGCLIQLREALLYELWPNEREGERQRTRARVCLQCECDRISWHVTPFLSSTHLHFCRSAFRLENFRGDLCIGRLCQHSRLLSNSLRVSESRHQGGVRIIP